jgi:hypothetical protein
MARRWRYDTIVSCFLLKPVFHARRYCALASSRAFERAIEVLSEISIIERVADNGGSVPAARPAKRARGCEFGHAISSIHRKFLPRKRGAEMAQLLDITSLISLLIIEFLALFPVLLKR